MLAEDAKRVVALWIDHYNTERLHSAIGYVTPLDKLEGRAAQILAERDRKLEDARLKRQQRRREAQRGQNQENGDDAGDEVTHDASRIARSGEGTPD